LPAAGAEVPRGLNRELSFNREGAIPVQYPASVFIVGPGTGLVPEAFIQKRKKIRII
jgi:hypothetical protein